MNVANLTATLNLDVSGFNNNTNVAITQINNIKNAAQNANNALLGMIRTGNQISALGRSISFAVTAPLTALGVEAFRTAARFDQFKQALTAITGSASEAERQMKRLNAIAKEPGIGIEEAMQGSINLQSVGLSANTAERAIRAFGNALVYSGRGKEELAGIETILSKIAGREILSERQLTQLTLRVPRMRALLKEAFGTGDVHAIQHSGLGPEEIINRLIWAAEQIPHVTGGIQNDIDNFKDSVTRSFKNIGDAMVPVAHDILPKLGDAIEKVSNDFANLTTAQKESILGWGAFAIAIGPVIIALGNVITALGRIKLLIETIKASSFVGSGGALALGIPLAAGVIANEAGKAVDRSQGKQDVNDFDMLSRVPGILWHDVKSWAVGMGGKLPRWAESQADRDSYEGNLPGANQPINLPPKAKGADKPEAITPVLTAQEQRQIFRAKLQAELEAARAGLSDSSTTHAQDELKRLGPLLLRQAQDLKREAAEMHVGRKSTAKEWEDYYKIQGQASQLEGQMNRLQRGATKERLNQAKQARNANYTASEYEFHMNEDSAMAEGLYDSEGVKSQNVFARVAPVLRQRQAQIIQMWNMVGKDTENANEAIVRRRQLEAEYYSIERKGAMLQREAAHERLQNEKKAEQERKNAFTAYREFQKERISAMAREAPDGMQALAILNAEVPTLRDEQKELLARQQQLSPNTKEYWDNAKAFWSVEDNIHQLVKNAVTERNNEVKKAVEQHKKDATEHREMISLETKLMEMRLKNNPLLTDRQRQALMVPMLVRQYRQMLIPIQGETELESLRRQIDAEGMKHDIMQSLGALGKAGSRVLGGGRIGNFDRRAVANVMRQLDAPMSAREQASYMSPKERAEQLAREANKGRPVVIQLNVENDPSKIGNDVMRIMNDLNNGAIAYPQRH